MKRTITLAAAAMTLLGFSMATRAVEVNFTGAEGYTTGTNLNGQLGWVAQTQWTVEAVGDGVAQATNTTYVRANYQAESASNNSPRDQYTVGVTFTLIGDFTATSNNLPDFAEPALILDVTEEGGATPSGRMGATVAVDDDMDPPELLFLFTAAAETTNSVASLGAATNYNGDTFTLDLEYTKLTDTNYSVTATLDSANDGLGPYVITNGMVTPDAAFAAAGLVSGFFNAQPGANNGYGGVQVDQFRFAEIPHDIIASTPVEVPGFLQLNAIKHITELETMVQVASNLTGASWDDIPETLTPGGEPYEVQYRVANGLADAEAHYRVVQIVPPPPPFFDDFEGADMGWTNRQDAGVGITLWEQGTPAFNGGFTSNNTAASGTQCWGTDLDDDYDAGIPAIDITLVSPVFTMPANGPATLEWNEWLDVDDRNPPGDVTYVYLIDVTAGSTTEVHNATGSVAVWGPVSAALPDTSLGNQVQLEFRFLSNGDGADDFGGWYIDDVAVTVP